MRNRTLLVGGATVVAAAAVGAVALLWDPAPAGTPVGAAGGGEPALASGALPPLVAGAPGAAASAAASAAAPVEPPIVTPAAIRAQPSARADVDWREIPVAVRFSDLGPQLAAPVKKSLDEARDRMDHCFQAEARALAAGAAEPMDADAPGGGSAVLVLSLESRPDGGGLDVVATALESRGTSTRALVACCRKALQGWTIDAPAPANRRYRLKLLLE